MMGQLVRKYPTTVGVLLLMTVVYAGQLFCAGSLDQSAAYTVAASLPTGGYFFLSPWLHSSHSHILENAAVFAILGVWTERRVGSTQLATVIVVTGYLTNLAPPALNFGGLGRGASGITNALWANFTAIQFVKYQSAIQVELPDIRLVFRKLALGFVGLLFVLKTVAEFTGYLTPSPGTATGAHILGILIGFGWFVYWIVQS